MLGTTRIGLKESLLQISLIIKGFRDTLTFFKRDNLCREFVWNNDVLFIFNGEMLQILGHEQAEGLTNVVQ